MLFYIQLSRLNLTKVNERGDTVNKIKYFREKQNMSQDQLAQKSGISRQTISALENNENYDVKIGTMVSIADALGKKVQDIFFPK